MLGLSCTYCCIVLYYSAFHCTGALLYSLLCRIYLFYVQYQFYWSCWNCQVWQRMWLKARKLFLTFSENLGLGPFHIKSELSPWLTTVLFLGGHPLLAQFVLFVLLRAFLSSSKSPQTLYLVVCNLGNKKMPYLGNKKMSFHQIKKMSISPKTRSQLLWRIDGHFFNFWK